MPSHAVLLKSYGWPTIMILLVILTQRRQTESDPPRRQDRPEELEAADVHVLRIRPKCVAVPVPSKYQPIARRREGVTTADVEDNEWAAVSEISSIVRRA